MVLNLYYGIKVEVTLEAIAFLQLSLLPFTTVYEECHLTWKPQIGEHENTTKLTHVSAYTYIRY